MAITQVSALINGVVKNLNAGTDGSGNIAPGHVLLDSAAAAFGVTGNELAIKGNVGLVAGANAIGTVALNAAIPAGANAIGTVGVTSLPALPTGTNSIGSVSNIAANVDTAALVTLSAASAGGNSADQTNVNGKGLQLGINITAITGTSPTLTVTVQGKDAASGVYYTLLTSAALSAVAFTQLTVYPGAAATANVSTPQPLPRTWRVLYAIAGTTPAVTATVGASVIV